MEDPAAKSPAQQVLSRIARMIGVPDHESVDLAEEVWNLIAGLASGASPGGTPPKPEEFAVLGTPNGLPALVFSRLDTGRTPVFAAHLVIDDEGRVFVLMGEGVAPLAWDETLAWIPLRRDQDNFVVPVGWVPLMNMVRGDFGDATQAMQAARMVGQTQRELARLRRVCREVIPRKVIPCPECGVEHVDGENGAEFATRPHHTHLCAACGHQWDAGEWAFGVSSASLAPATAGDA